MMVQSATKTSTILSPFSPDMASGGATATSPCFCGNNNGEMLFYWDANGNMTQQWHNQGAGFVRNMCWDEENRLKVLYDEGYNLSTYLYDAGGERVLKLTSNSESLNINGMYQLSSFILNNYTLYTSPYMVLTPETYTKHYYIEADRVVSKIGGGFAGAIQDITDHVYGFDVQCLTTYADKNNDNLQMINRDIICAGFDPGLVDVNADIDYWLGYAKVEDNYEEFIFFYHKDHLGSSTQISDNYANIIHHIEYMPYGELFYEQRDYWGTPYKFNAKELDSETGMYYYGARYYTPELSIWLSVDPLSDKYPGTSAYMYTLGNPIKFIDPNGMEVEYSTIKDKLYTSTLRLFSSTFRNQYRILKNSTETYVFKGFSDGSSLKDGEFNTDGDKLFINYNFIKNEGEGTNWTNHLKHESEHGVQFEHGEFGFVKQDNKWSVYNFDLSDEKKARDVGYSGFTLNRNIDNSKNRWNSNKTTDDNRYEALINVGYNGTTRKVNTNMFKIKTENTYMMPYRKR